MGRVHNRDAGVPLPGLLQNRLGQHLEGPVGGGRTGDGVNLPLALPVQELACVVAGILDRKSVV